MAQISKKGILFLADRLSKEDMLKLVDIENGKDVDTSAAAAMDSAAGLEAKARQLRYHATNGGQGFASRFPEAARIRTA